MNNLLQVFLYILEVFCFSGVIFSFIIAIKLLLMKQRISFINMMFIVVFSLNCVSVSIHIVFFFKVGFRNFLNELSPHDQLVFDCKMSLITRAMGTIIFTCITVGMLFCRFIYARYANGLNLLGKTSEFKPLPPPLS